MRYRALIQAYLPLYSEFGPCNKREKSKIVSDIVNYFKKASPEGGFVRLRNEMWYRVPDRVAREKTGQMFREWQMKKTPPRGLNTVNMTVLEATSMAFGFQCYSSSLPSSSAAKPQIDQLYQSDPDCIAGRNNTEDDVFYSREELEPLPIGEVPSDLSCYDLSFLL